MVKKPKVIQLSETAVFDCSVKAFRGKTFLNKDCCPQQCCTV